MFKNNDVLIENLIIDGKKELNLIFEGTYLKRYKFKVLIDGKDAEVCSLDYLDKKHVYDRILKQNQNRFSFYVNIPSGTKKIEIYYNNNLIITKELDKSFKRNLKIKKFFSRLKRLPKIMFKTLKLMWQRHHFIVPPRLLKQYIHSFKNNISAKNVDELLYNPLVDNDYQKWIEENKEDIKIKRFRYKPKFSIIIPTYNVSNKLLSDCLDSVLNQSYTNFEICIADDHSSLKETIDTLKKYEKNSKVIITYRKKNGHISEASNSALKLATGDFIALLDNDDVLDKNALYYMVEKINEDRSLDLIYSDEDKLDFNGKRCFPHFKPDFSLDTLLSSNYFCHFTVIRKSIIDEIKGFRSEYNGAQDYDLFLRIIDKTKKIGHVPKILYHWRMTKGSTSSSGGNKDYAYFAGKRALEDYFKRNNIKTNVELIGNPQMYQVHYLFEIEPKISIIIPTKDKSNVLDKCLKSIIEKTNYKNYEIIVIDNNSIENKTFDLMEKYKKKYEYFNYYRLECEFNYSYINNYAVSKSNGEYIVLLNNDTEIISSNWLRDMVGFAMQDHVGCVGAKLLYPNRTVQHCGVVTGVGGVAMHAFVSTGDENYGYFGRLVSVYDWSCVTAACLMIKKEKYNLVNGLDEKLKVAYNDVDLNLKLLDKGLYNVVLPHVKLFHYESLSRGNDMSDSQRQRFTREINYMCDKWGTKLLNDPFYNINLSHTYAFRLDKNGGKNE